jgi:hypothetical protein
MGLEQAVNGRFRYKIALCVSELDRQLPRALLWNIEGKFDNLMPDIYWNAISHVPRQGTMIRKGVNAAQVIKIVPTVECGSWSAALANGTFRQCG